MVPKKKKKRSGSAVKSFIDQDKFEGIKTLSGRRLARSVFVSCYRIANT